MPGCGGRATPAGQGKLGTAPVTTTTWSKPAAMHVLAAPTPTPGGRRSSASSLWLVPVEARAAAGGEESGDAWHVPEP